MTIFSLKELLSVLSVARCSSHCSCSNRKKTHFLVSLHILSNQDTELYEEAVLSVPASCLSAAMSVWRCREEGSETNNSARGSFKFRNWLLTFHSLCTDRHCSIASRTQTFHSYLLMVNTSHTVSQSKMMACTFLRHFSLTPTAPLPTTNLMDHVSHRYSLG